MARKTAMGKEPGSVSVALPQSEKDRLRGGGQRMPGKPRPMDDKGNFTDKQSLDRVSPGVYRNSQGKLVGSKGQALPKRSPIQNALQGAAQAAGQQTNIQPAPRPGQQFSQQEIDAGMQAGNLARNIAGSYGGQEVPNLPPPSFAQGSIDQIMRDRLGQGMQPNPFQFSQGQQPPIQNLMYRYPVGTQVPDLGQINGFPQQPQQAQPQQPQSISGLLQRFR